MTGTSTGRDVIYCKLGLLAQVVTYLGSDQYQEVFSEDDFFALHLFLSDIAKEIYPEWNDKPEQEQATP